jgi:SAM-dependent methyltransferase
MPEDESAPIPTGDAGEIAQDASRLRQNAFLYEIHRDFYRRILHELSEAEYPRVLELGSGGGFLRDLAPRVISSDCVMAPGIDRVVDACQLSEHFGAGELDGICAVNVFHHLPNPSQFLRGATGVLRAGGRIVMVEPWCTPLGQWFHRLIHHEPFVADPSFWGIVGMGRLTAANTRLPTSVFRDSAERFRTEFPNLRIAAIQPFHKWLYLLSGGLRFNTRVPLSLARILIAADVRTRFADSFAAIFALIVVERT